MAAGDRTTYLRISTSVEMFHRIEAEGDMPEHRIGTTDSLISSGIGGTWDVIVESDPTVNVEQQFLTAVVEGGTAASAVGTTNFHTTIIKHTGFTDSTKDTVSTDELEIGFGAALDGGLGVRMGPGGVYVLPKMSDNLSEGIDIFFESTGTGTIYVEIISVQ